MRPWLPPSLILAAALSACAPAPPEPLLRLSDIYPASRPGQFAGTVRLRSGVQSGEHGIMLVDETCTVSPCLIGSIEVPARLENTPMVQAMYASSRHTTRAGRLVAELRVQPRYIPRPSRSGHGLDPPSPGPVRLVEVLSLTTIAANRP